MNLTEIIGSPIKIENLEIAQNDFPSDMIWSDALKSCEALGDSWRLPTIEEWKAMHSSQKIPNTTQRIDHTTLVSGVNRAFVGQHDKEDNNRDQKLLLSLDDTRYFTGKIRGTAPFRAERARRV